MNKFQQDLIIKESTTDKISHHGYHRFYPWFLTHLRGQNVNFLEIGIDKTESLKLWKGYFGSVNLHGLDIDDKEFNDTEVTLHKIDQSNALELDKFVATVGIKFDVILDDGSHVPEHQILTINKLWDLVEPGGIYIIEDIETSYWKKSEIYGYRFNAGRRGIMHEFIKLIDIINSEFSKNKNQSLLEKKLSQEVEMVTFAQNCIILVKKDYQNFNQYYNRDYRFDENINARSILNFPNRIGSILNFPNRIVRKLRSFKK